MDEQIQCRKCKHLYVTWDSKFPHGCKAMGFKSAKMPSAEVFAASGMGCKFFKEKTPKPS
jgi:hypothetical protein